MKSTFHYIGILLGVGLMCCQKHVGQLELKPTLEHVMADNSPYNPSTQSLLRTHSWMEGVSNIALQASRKSIGTIALRQESDDHYMKLVNLPMRYLVPRLHYPPADPPDEFDALNLMLAEFSRNSVSMPFGKTGDDMTHFETSLKETVPWRLEGDFDFVPNKYYKPLRVSVINNCLRAGLWELNAVDRSGEIYHGWFDMPLEYYYNLTSEVNQLDPEFIKKATTWTETEVELVLDRLREEKENFGKQAIEVIDREIGFSSQGSRRKISKNFVMYEDKNSEVSFPERLSDLYTHPTVMASFIEPGIYSIKEEDRSKFDFTFLAYPRNVEVKLVEPETSYNWIRKSGRNESDVSSYIELNINLGDDEHIIMGNLPMNLLVEQEDFVLHGFGVGILSPGGFAERRNFLIEGGPCPSYAYLAKRKNGKYHGINSHVRGIEQIFIRSHPDAPNPYWDVIITSYERIVDIVHYKVNMPNKLVPQQKEYKAKYIPPIYFTYRDDNVN